MKKALKRFMSYSVYRKSLYAYAVGIVVLTVLILFSLFGAVSSSVKKSAVENSELILKQLAGTSDYIKLDVDNLMSMLASDSDALNFMGSKKESKTANYYLHNKLISYKSSHSYVVDISVVNLDNQISVQASGTNVNRSANLDFVEKVMEAGDLVVPRQITLHSPVREYNVVSFLYYLPYSQSAVVVDVDANRFRLAIAGDGAAGREVAVVDENGNWIVYPDQSPIPELTPDYLEKILAENTESSGQFTYDDPENKVILFFSRSETLGWWFIDAQSYSQFFKTYTTISFWFIGVALALMAVCCGLSAFFGRRIQKLLVQLAEKYKLEFETDIGNEIETRDEIQYLDWAIARVEHERYLNDKYVTSLYLRSVLLGEDMPFFISQDRQATFRKKYEAPYYCVLLLRIHQDVSEGETDMGQDLNMQRYVACNMSTEIFGAEYRCVASDLGGDLVAVLLLLDSSHLGEEYLLCFRSLKEFAKNHTHLQFSGSLGTVVDEFESIRYSCSKARQYLNMDSLVGKGDLIDSNSVSNASYQEKNEKLVESVVEYTKENFNDPGLSLKSISQKFGLSTTYLGKIFKSVKGTSYSSFVTGCRLEQSKLALVETSKTINEISEEVGFSNSTYFATVFKNTFGLTPTAYRNNAKK